MLCISVDVSKDYEQVENVLKQVRSNCSTGVCIKVISVRCVSSGNIFNDDTILHECFFSCWRA